MLKLYKKKQFVYGLNQNSIGNT